MGLRPREDHGENDVNGLSCEFNSPAIWAFVTFTAM
jgi:hypothetical protein